MNSEKADAFYGVRLPSGLADELDKAVRDEDTDSSKFIRAAIRERLVQLGYLEPKPSRAIRVAAESPRTSQTVTA